MLEARRIPVFSADRSLAIKVGVTNRRHQQDVAVIRNPGAAEMRVTETVDDRVRIVVTGAPVPTRETRVRTELDHTERHDRARERVAVTGGADEWIDVTCEIALRGDLQWEEKQKTKDAVRFSRGLDRYRFQLDGTLFMRAPSQLRMRPVASERLQDLADPKPLPANDYNVRATTNPRAPHRNE